MTQAKHDRPIFNNIYKFASISSQRYRACS